MNTAPIDAIAKAVLYEGYMLYPYRPSSVKNRQRFNFGVLYPRWYSEVQAGSSDGWSLQTEVPVEGNSVTNIEIRVRFLKLVERSARQLTRVSDECGCAPIYEAVEVGKLDSKSFEGRAGMPWQEAMECEVNVPAQTVERLTTEAVEWSFSFPAQRQTEVVRDAEGQIAGQIVRKQELVCGAVELSAVRVRDDVFKVRVLVRNLTPVEAESAQLAREGALMRSLVSAHIVLGVEEGSFVSLLEPAEGFAQVASSCENSGAWPVLVGAEGARDTMLASPIILYDYPQTAPESPGDLFDGTEIDEILALRILTMTAEEKNEMRNSDERARLMLERTEALPMEQLMKLHGTLRELRPQQDLQTQAEETP